MGKALTQSLVVRAVLCAADMLRTTYSICTPEHDFKVGCREHVSDVSAPPRQCSSGLQKCSHVHAHVYLYV